VSAPKVPWFDPAGFSVRNWQFTAIVFLLLTALGLQAWIAIPRAEDPTFDAPNFGIFAVWPGASPSDVEAQLVDRIEDRLAGLSDIEKIRSTAQDGVAVVNVEYRLDGTPADDRYGELVRELDGLRDELPDGLDRIEVVQFEPSLVNVLQLALVDDTSGTSDVRDAAEALEKRIEAVPGVVGVDVTGLADERLAIEVDGERLAAMGIPVDAVFQALQTNDAQIPGGWVEAGKRRLAVTTDAEWKSIDELNGTVIAAYQGSPVRLGDVATVRRESELADHAARLDGHRAVWLGVRFRQDANVFDTRDAVLAAAQGVALPDGMRQVVAFDQSRNVAHRLAGFGRDFAIAIALVLLTLLPLGWRASSVVMVAIPLSLASGLILLQASGYSINQLSIVGFVIALGLLVDDAIVVVENISRHLRMGKDRTTAAIDGTREIALAVLGCTATLLLAFLPLLLLPGTAGLFIRSLPLAVIYTIIASLGVSLTIVPLLASVLLRDPGEHGNVVLQGLERGIEGSYRRVLDQAIRRPYVTLAAAAVLFVGALALVPVVGFSVFPKAGLPMFRIEVDSGDGASMATTDAAVRAVEAELAKHPEVTQVLANVGAGNPRVYYNVAPASPRSSVGEVMVTLDEYDAVRTPILLDSLRETFRAYPGARITVKEFENGPPVEAPVAVRLVGDDLDALREGSAAVAGVLGGVDGLYHVEDPLAAERTDLHVGIRRETAGQLGVSASEVARVVRFGLAGLEVGKFTEPDGDELPIVAELSGDGLPDPDRLARLHVARAAGGTLPLAEVADLRLQSGPAAIKHRDGVRSATVTADVRTGSNTAALTSVAADRLAKLDLPDGVTWKLAGEAETSQESFGNMGAVVLIALFGVLAVLVLEFGTFRSTLVVLSVVPLGVVGGIAALFLTGNTLSFTASIGFVALIGIEVKNSILLVDFANQLRERGMALDAAIARAGETRFVPILLTTMTALGGLVPLALEGSSLYSPLAWVLIGGLVSSTILTRVVTPVVYKLLAPSIHTADAPAVDALAVAAV
jgi:multidrug efflux pump subunit AcrB